MEKNYFKGFKYNESDVCVKAYNEIEVGTVFLHDCCKQDKCLKVSHEWLFKALSTCIDYLTVSDLEEIFNIEDNFLALNLDTGRLFFHANTNMGRYKYDVVDKDFSREFNSLFNEIKLNDILDAIYENGFDNDIQESQFNKFDKDTRYEVYYDAYHKRGWFDITISVGL